MTRRRVPDKLFAFRDRYVTIAGEIVAVAIEDDPDPRKIDHVWITVQAGEFGKLQISLSTLSRQSRAAGFDERVRVGMLASAWTDLPPAGLRPAASLDYSLVEAGQPIEYVACARRALEELLTAKAWSAIYVEACGEFYIRQHVGIHQVHSRRASLAVPREVIGRDGAIWFYFAAGKRREMFLFKFAGQP